MKIKVKAIGNRPAREVCDWEKLTKALENVNGRAHAHTADCYDVVHAVIDAEQNLDALKILKRDRKDARFVFVSGKPVTNAYSNKAWWRAATRIELVRGAQANTWFAVDIQRTEIDSRGGSYTTCLTSEQADIATNRGGRMLPTFFRNFSKLKVLSQPIAQANKEQNKGSRL